MYFVFHKRKHLPSQTVDWKKMRFMEEIYQVGDIRITSCWINQTSSWSNKQLYLQHSHFKTTFRTCRTSNAWNLWLKRKMNENELIWIGVYKKKNKNKNKNKDKKQKNTKTKQNRCFQPRSIIHKLIRESNRERSFKMKKPI